jgi:hypothetical protein
MHVGSCSIDQHDANGWTPVSSILVHKGVCRLCTLPRHEVECSARRPCRLFVPFSVHGPFSCWHAVGREAQDKACGMLLSVVYYTGCWLFPL